MISTAKCQIPGSDCSTAVCVVSTAGKHTANSHQLSALVTPAGKSYVCQAQQTIHLYLSDHQKSIDFLLSEVQIQPFDITNDFAFSEGKIYVSRVWGENGISTPVHLMNTIASMGTWDI